MGFLDLFTDYKLKNGVLKISSRVNEIADSAFFGAEGIDESIIPKSVSVKGEHLCGCEDEVYMKLILNEIVKRNKEQNGK